MVADSMQYQLARAKETMHTLNIDLFISVKFYFIFEIVGIKNTSQNWENTLNVKMKKGLYIYNKGDIVFLYETNKKEQILKQV